MKPGRRSIGIVLAALLAIGPVAPILAQDGEIPLVPFTSDTFGVEGVLPKGWSEAAPGIYMRAESADDLATLIIQAVPDMTAEILAGALAGQLGVDALPEAAGTLKTDALSWTLYQIGIEEAGLSIQIDLALTENEAGAALVLLQTLDTDYDTLHQGVFIPVVEALAPIGAEIAASEQPEENGLYQDPQGRFSVPVPTNWRAEARDGYAFLYSPDELITIALVVVETSDPAEALVRAWEIVDPAFDKAIVETTETPAAPLEHFVTTTYAMDNEAETLVQGQVRVYEGLSYVGIIRADLTEGQQRAAQLDVIDTGFAIAAIETTDLSAVEPLPLTDALIAEFEAYIETAMETYQTPGAAVALVRDGEIVYARGFGVRNPQGDPVTPETRMLIGSTTKTMTTLLMAQMVDEGIMDWDTPAIDILPTFAVADPELTQAITMENMVCACTGVPRRDAELFFTSGNLTAEGIMASLSTFEFFTDFGETFQYSNQMVASAGYLTTLAAGGEYGTLYEDYVRLLEERVFQPLDMESTTFSYAEAIASDNYAVPYGLFVDFSFRPLPLELEEYWSAPIAPAGGAWSTALDMAKYMVMELSEGVAAAGNRIVSAEQLAHTWEPQVAITAVDEYGLGWLVSNYYGLRILSHGGNMLGFTAEFDFLPERDLGVVVLTNQRLSLLNAAVVLRLFEMLFAQPYAADQEMQLAFEQMRAPYLKRYEQSQRIADPETAAVTVGSYTNEALGNVEIRLNAEGALLFDAGEFQSELWLYTPDEGQTDAHERLAFVLYDPPVAGSEIHFKPDEQGVYQMTLGEGANEYVFTRIE